jgi:hypothetical protein
MEKRIILIDLENIAPKNIEEIYKNKCEVYAFIRTGLIVPRGITSTDKKLGKKIKFIRTKPGKNVSDFFIATYVGKFIEKHGKGVHIQILTNDKGFVPVIEHLVEDGFHVYKTDTLAFINKQEVNRSIQVIKNILDIQKPKSLKTLGNAIQSSTLKVNCAMITNIIIKHAINNRIIKVDKNKKIIYEKAA